MSHDRSVMSRWMQESLTALQDLRGERNRHEKALEAAMEAIRVHTQEIERLEHDIEVIENAVAGTSDVSTPPATADDDHESSARTEIRRLSDITPPSAPPLRPVPPARVLGHS